MRVTRLKTAKKHLNFYKHKFGLREPYQILVDGNFCHAALENKIHIKEQLPKLLGASCKELVTPCVLEELKSLGDSFRGALLIAKRFEVRSCGHRGQLKAAHECLSSLVGHENNPNHYIVATQDLNLRKQLRLCPAVPLMYVQYNVIVMESPSDASKLEAKHIDQTKLVPKEYEQRFIDHLEIEQSTTGNSSTSIPKKLVTRKRKAKGPNPLSILKKKKKSHSSSAASPSLPRQTKIKHPS